MNEQAPIINDDEMCWSIDMLLTRYGGQADFIAAQHAGELLLSGDTKGYRLWMQIWLVVDHLFAEKPPKGVTIH
jgi:hypothetical protein